MWVRRHENFYPDILTDQIWAIWTDVNNWAQWQDDLDFCHMDGDFVMGQHFMLKPKGVGAVKITLTDVVDKHSFTDCTSFFGAKMYDTHKLEQKNAGVLLSHETSVVGLLQWLWVVLVAKDVAKTAPAQMDALVKRAQEKMR